MLEGGKASVRGTDLAIEITELARAAYHQSHRFGRDLDPELSVSATYDPAGTYSNACHVALVEVDPETGHVALERFLVVEDAGRLINPMIVNGQICGGVAQGIANALFEEVVYDAAGNILTGSLADYLPPTCAEIPPIEIVHLETTSDASVTKAKGLGEGGAIGAPAAVLGAISDALRPFGIEVLEMPRRRSASGICSGARRRDAMTGKVDLVLEVNGRNYEVRVEPRRTLADALREDCGLTGTHLGCEHGVCGACTVLVDGEPVGSCLMFAVQAEGAAIRTVEGLANGEELHPLQQAFWDHHGLQCGFCTPGFLMLAAGVLEKQPTSATRSCATCCVQSLPLHRLSEHHQGRARRGRPDEAVSLIGQGVRRLEDRPLLTGAGRFAADISFPHQLAMRVVRSPVAFGRLRAVDVRAALRAPGVVAVWTGADVAEVPPIDFRMTRVAGLEPYRQPMLAREFVRYVGEPVACVFAEDAYLAEDAAELVAPEIEELTPIVSATAPPGEFAPGISSEAATISKSYGDLDQAFRQAHAVVELELAVGRHSGVPLETRGAIARYDAGRDRLRAVRRRQGAALQPRCHRRDARYGAWRAAALRGARRRRLRHPRRAVSRGRSGLPRGAPPRPPGQVDRGSLRASDRGQPFARSGAPGASGGRSRGLHPRPSRTSSGRTRAPTSGPTPPRSPI